MKNKFVMFRTEQSIVLLLLNIAAGIIGTITCGIGLVLISVGYISDNGNYERRKR
ncbi:MAG: hypothetical protein IPM96_13955 [Ignavibacteria bacterium]|nr:hypothetical protein [Ignavibacteria bacterium]